MKEDKLCYTFLSILCLINALTPLGQTIYLQLTTSTMVGIYIYIMQIFQAEQTYTEDRIKKGRETHKRKIKSQIF